MRLNRYIAQSGIASRRKADELIENGNVKINGAAVTKMGVQVNEGDVVSVNGKIIEPEKKNVYIILNKPAGYITSMKDEWERPVVGDLVTDVHERIFPVGRLDYNTTGLLILTNDGELANRLTHPKHEVTKTYRATVAGVVSGARVAKLRSGVDIGGFVTSEARVEIIKQGKSSAVVEIEIHEGKNRQVRKMFSAVGNPVQELERIAVGKITIGRLRQGDYRRLKGEEINYLKNL